MVRYGYSRCDDNGVKRGEREREREGDTVRERDKEIDRYTNLLFIKMCIEQYLLYVDAQRHIT